MNYRNISENYINLISYFEIIFLYIIRYDFYKTFLGFRKKNIKFLVLFCLLILLDLSSQIFIKTNASYFSQLLQLTITTLLYIYLFLLIYIFFKGNVVIKIYSILIENVAWLLIALAQLPVNFYLMPKIHELTISPTSHVIIGLSSFFCISLINLLAVYLFLKKICTYINFNQNLTYSQSFFLLVPCLSTYGLACIFYYLQEFNINKTTYFLPYISPKIYYILLPLISILLGLSLIIVVYILKTMIDSEEKDKKLLLIEHQFDMQSNYIDNLQKHYNDIRKIKHDIKNHIICLKSLADSNNLNEMKSYLSKLDNVVETSNFKIKTGHPISDCIINEKFNIATSKHIDFNCNFLIPKNISIDSLDLCIILGNSLDNAIEACDKITNLNIHKEINLKSYMKELYLLIEIRNSIQEPIKYVNNKIQTTKPNKLIHGIGLSSIKQIAEKYNGFVDIIQEKNFFNLSIMLQIKNS